MFFYLDEVDGIMVISVGGHAGPRTQGVDFKTQLVSPASSEGKAHKL
jgi:hypothetical protein